ncbi:hypothetical protein MTR67_003052 [Solanum verrucosum]|uniref:Uncharacterized protein n=1 Tax=Solanum verrucosum TaxID=315347 RepID=A0AAF0T6I6_SOLVR|nr:hypothetical protein MTR67_003052 [Solanum verrucosum]
MEMAAESSSATESGLTEKRGIPAASFVEDVQSYLNQSGLDVNSALAFLQERSLSSLCDYDLFRN